MDNFLWVEKYRPQKIEDCILPEHLKKTFSNIVSSGVLPNMMFTGTAGLGKTTAARAICSELDLDAMVINGSEEGNIDTLRGKIKRYASSVSVFGKGIKVVILDEADYLNPQSTQPALRGFIEEFSDNSRFILTCNFKNRIIEPIHSRCGVYEFNTTKKDMAALCGQFLSRAKYIMKQENQECNDKALVDMILRYAPDWRRVLNELQRGAISGTSTQDPIDTINYHTLFDALKKKEFKKMRNWVANNSDVDTSVIIRTVYDNMFEKIEATSIPQLVIILADYQYKNAFVADREVNMVACLTEIMLEVNFK